MSTDKLDALIVRNLRDLDIATKRLYFDIQDRIGKVIDDVIESWAKKHGWQGKFKWNDEGTWLAPPEWKSPDSTEEDAWLGCFYLDAGPGDDFDFEANKEEDFYWLTRLCHAGHGMICFWWSYDNGLGATRSKWKKFANDAAGNWIEPVDKAGFTYDEGSGGFFMPIRIEAEALAAAIEEDFVERALEQPLQQALDKLRAAKPVFDSMLKGAKQYFQI